MLSLRVTLEIHRIGPKNINYPSPLEVNPDSGRVKWIVPYPDNTDNFVCVKHCHFNYAKYYKLQCA